MRGKKIRIAGVVLALLLVAGVFFSWGLTLGLEIPREINITVDTGENYDRTVNQMQHTAELLNNRSDNKSCPVCPDLQCPTVNCSSVNTICENTAAAKTMSFCRLGRVPAHLKRGREAYLLEQGKPVMIEGNAVAVLGANDVDSTVVLSINGSRHTMKEGEAVYDGSVTYLVDKIFVINIPKLDAWAYVYAHKAREMKFGDRE
jgi:hypothetical protein